MSCEKNHEFGLGLARPHRAEERTENGYVAEKWDLRERTRLIAVDKTPDHHGLAIPETDGGVRAPFLKAVPHQSLHRRAAHEIHKKKNKVPESGHAYFLPKKYN